MKIVLTAANVGEIAAGVAKKLKSNFLLLQLLCTYWKYLWRGSEAWHSFV